MGCGWISTPEGHRWAIDFLTGAWFGEGAPTESQVGSSNLVGSFRKIEDLARLRIWQECFHKIDDGSHEGLTKHNPCALVTIPFEQVFATSLRQLLSKMVLTAAQIIAFFEEPLQCGLENRTRIDSLDAEGISSIDDLAEWEDDDWDQWSKNCKRPDKSPDPNNPGQLIDTVPYSLSVKSLKRLKIASKLVRYYQSVSIGITASNMRWVVLKNFSIQIEAMSLKSKESNPEIPKMTNKLSIAKWDDSLRAYMSLVFGARNATLEYLMRPAVAVVNPHPPLKTDCPHSDVGSIQDEQILRLSHTHPLYKEDNKRFYGVLETALRGTTYDTSINSFKKTSDGRGAYLALISQHAGKDKWIKILRTAKTYVNEAKWDGTTSQLLQSHIERIRESYVDIENAAQHIKEQIPDPRTRVQSLIDSIEGCTDAKVCARVAAISNETNGMLDDFEKAVTHLIPVCPVAAKVGKKRNRVTIAGVEGNSISKKEPKTGVELRYYTSKEYGKLSKEEMAELKELRPAKRGKNKQKSKPWKGNQSAQLSGKAWINASRAKWPQR